jgi:excisionase family DNA binding protein
MNTPETGTDADRLLSVREAAEVLRVSEHYVYRLLAGGQLGFTRIGLRKGLRIAERDLQQFLAGRHHKPRRPVRGRAQKARP